MSDLYDVVKVEIDKVIKEAKDSYADGVLSLGEVWGLGQDLVFSIMTIVEAYNATGADKKAAVMIAASRLYDEVLAPIDIPKIPNVIEPSFDKFGRVLFLELISGSIDYMVKFVEQKK